MEHSIHHESTIRDYVRLLRRRKFIVLTVAILLPALAVGFSLRQPAQYQATAKVLLKQGNLAATLSGIEDTSVYLDPTRVAQTQIELASTPAVAKRVLQAAGIEDRTPDQLLGSLAIVAEPDADILDFSVTDGDPAMAELLANEYAREYTEFRSELDTAALDVALDDVENRIEELRAEGRTSSASTLVGRAEQLRTLRALQNANAVIARPADVAAQVAPRPVRYGMLGLVLGLMLGIGLAFTRDALDTRVRSAEEVGQQLNLPLLARVPPPPRKLQRDDRLVMLERPESVEAEAFRVLRTNLDFANLDRGARSILVTSALEREGKSTTAANLAIAAARAGKRVALVDLDLRRPYLNRFFDLGTARYLDGGDRAAAGLTNVVLGQATLDQALARIPFPPAGADGRRLVSAEAMTGDDNGRRRVDGFLDVLPAGPIPPDAGELVGTSSVFEIIDTLQRRYELVLVDTPPLLHVGDALTLATRVDAMVIVTHLRAVRRPILRELRRVLEACPAASLGFVLAGADLEEGYGYGYGYYRYAEGKQSPARERQRVSP